MRSAWNTRVAGCLWRSRAARHARDHLRRARSVRSNGRVCAVGDDGARDARRQPLLAEFAEDARSARPPDAPLTTSAALGPSPSLMRMSSGPSCMKLKPRCGIVELRRGDAEVEQDAVELEAGLDLVGARGERGEWREENRDARIGARSARRASAMATRIAVEAQQPAVSDELLQDRPCMSASPKSGVQIDAASPECSTPPVPEVTVPACASPHRSRSPALAHAYSDSVSRSAGKSVADSSLASHSSRRSFQRASSHNSKRTPCPISIASRVSEREFAQFGGSSIRP